MLQYCDNYIDDNILDTIYEDNELETIKLLMPYIDGIDSFDVDGGSNISDMVNGLNKYLNDNIVSSISFSSNKYSESIYKSCIKSNKLVIIDLDDHPTYGEHWVIGYGYYISSGKILNVVCVDGWGNSYVNIPIDYIGDIVYIE